MWMQQSMESSSIAHGNPHQRNRFGPGIGSGSGSGASSYEQRGSYSGGGSGVGHGGAKGDWKSKLVESGQWLGGKVIEYGGKLARGGSHDSIPDHMAQQHPRNDGRANWMADIRNSSSSFNNGSSYSGGGSAYQNDFATERPKAYSDFGGSSSTMSTPAPYSSSSSYTAKPLQPARDRRDSAKEKRRSKKDQASKSSKKGKKKHAKRRGGHSSEDSDSDSDESSQSDSPSDASSASKSSNDRRRSKAKAKVKKSKKRRDSYTSEEEDSLETKAKPVKASKPEKAPADYSFSFDPSKLPSPPPDDEPTSKKASAKSKASKKSSKSRGRKQSMVSTDSDASEKENQRTTKVKLKSKARTKSNHETVDLLGVDLDASPVPTHPAAARTQEPGQAQPDIFSQPLNPLQDLAGLNFSTTYTQPAQPSPAFSVVTPPNNLVEEPVEVPSAGNNAQFINKLLPENDIVDFDSLANEKKREIGSTGPKKTLNELQRANQVAQQPQQKPVMPQQQMSVMAVHSQMPNPLMMQHHQQQQHGIHNGMANVNPMQMHMHMQMSQMNSMMHQMQFQQQSSLHPQQQMQQQSGVMSAMQQQPNGVAAYTNPGLAAAGQGYNRNENGSMNYQYAQQQ